MSHPPQPNQPRPNPRAPQPAPRRQARTRTPYPPQQPPVQRGIPPGQQPPRARRPRRRGRRGLAIGPGIIFGCMGIVGVLVVGFLISGWLVYDHYSDELEEQIAGLEKITDYQSFETTVIRDRYGNKLWEVFDEGRRTRIPLEQVPQHVIDATIAVEDDTFYENRGIDIPGILRAAQQYLEEGHVVSGGSTITQQLIKNVLFDYDYRIEQSIDRKLKEWLLAVILTQRMSKNEILELYLNEIYYGNMAYGIEAAAQTYFGKPASALTVAEGALLAGLPQAPAELDPLNPDPLIQEKVNARKRVVLDLMVKEEYLTQAEADAAYNEVLTYADTDIDLDKAPHFVVYSQSQLETLLVNELDLSQEAIKQMIARGGLEIYTTLDMDVQRVAEESARQQVAALSASNHLTNAAVVILNPPTGEILGMVGSVDYNNEAIDGNVNVTIAERQPGSAMKPFTYAAAMEHGWTAANIIWDTRTEIGIPGQPMYVPVNYDGAYHGPVRLREALANSYNIPAVQTLRQVGVEYLLWMMHRVGVRSLSDDPSRYGLSLTLGGGEVTPLELTNAFAVLANGGVYVPSTAIRCVLNSDNEIIYEYERGCPETATLTGSSKSINATGRRVIDQRIAFIISDILSDNNARSPAMGANSPLHTPNLPTSVKTGTTNDFKDNWTVGFTRNIAIGVWAGNTDNTPMQNVSGLQGAAPIWNQTMTALYNTPGLLDQALGQRLPDDEHLRPPGGVFQRQICNISRTALQDPATSCQPGYFEWFLDSPPLVPDNSGQMVQQPPTPAPQNSANGPQPTEIEPGLIKVAVFPVQPEMANAIATVDTSGKTVPPRYCQVPIEVAGMVPGVQEQLFIAPPPNPDDAFQARRWAQAAGVAILPQYACNEQMLHAKPQLDPNQQGPAGVTAVITSPQPGQAYNQAQNIDITGSAVFPQGTGGYYKVELRGGPFGDWTTLGDVNNWRNQSGVGNGVLESIMGGALSPGGYEVRLVIVGGDGNILAIHNSSFFIAS